MRARNPSVVYLSLSGFGQTGPWRLVPGHDLDGLGLDDVRALTLPEQLDRAEELRDRIGAVVGDLDQTEAVARLTATGAPVAPVHDRAGMVADPHLRERGTALTGLDGQPAMAHPMRDRDHPPLGPAEPPGPDDHAGQGFA